MMELAWAPFTVSWKRKFFRPTAWCATRQEDNDVLEKDVVPQTRWVEGSNFADVNFKIDTRTNRVVMMGAIDNMVKGAAGQAIQNMNLMFGLPENTGLKQIPIFP